jgi:predicted alpha/beta hydrolase family esterase
MLISGGAAVNNTIVYIVPGINNADSPADWDERAQALVQNYFGIDCERYQYHAGAITRSVNQSKRIADVSAWLIRNQGRRIICIGHSNGCELLCKALHNNPAVKVAELHLIAGACSSNCDRNRLNIAARRGQFLRTVCYVSSGDAVLGAAQWTSWLNIIGLGYGDLGKVGPKNVRGWVPEIVRRDSYGHCDWVGQHLAETIRLCIGVPVVATVYTGTANVRNPH